MFLYNPTVEINLYRYNITVKLIEQNKLDINIPYLTGKAWYIKLYAKQFAKYISKIYYNNDTFFLSDFVL